MVALVAILFLFLRLVTRRPIDLDKYAGIIMRRLLVFLVVLFAVSAIPCRAWSFGSKRVHVDPITKASILDGDATALVDCGAGHPAVGFCYLRQVEGAAADKTVAFLAPPSKCKRASCAFVKVYNNQGSLVWGAEFPKDKTRVVAPWRKLLGCSDDLKTPCNFEVDNRGFWTFTTQVYYLDQDGNEQSPVAQGDIVLRVYRKGYVPLDMVEGDPNFVWTWTDAGFYYAVTAGLRAYVGILK